MALIQGQKTVGAGSRRQYDKRCVREADPKIAVPADHLRSLLHVLSAEALEPVGAAGDFAEEKEFRSGPDSF